MSRLDKLALTISGVAIVLSGISIGYSQYANTLADCSRISLERYALLSPLLTVETKEEAMAAVKNASIRFPMPTFYGFEVCLH